MNVEFHPSTVTDVNSAKIYYNEKLPNLGEVFRNEVLQTIERIASNPQLYREVKGVRRALLRRFPYSILYRILDTGTIRILVVRHHRRHPNFGLARQ